MALKLIASDVDVTPELRTRFFREAQACARLSHPNIVTVHDMGEDGGRLFIVMEFLDGEDLRPVIAERRPMPLEEKLSTIAHVCETLSVAHQNGIVHRDVKPGNIFLLRNGRVKLLDFGIARIATSEGDLTCTGLVMGTPRYVAPEQLRGKVDARSDIFSVGAVLYELLVFQPPFPGDHPVEILDQLRTVEPRPLTAIDPEIPPQLERIVQRAMRKDPAERFADAQEMRL